MAFDELAPSNSALLAGVLLDVLVGDPQYALHPIRLMGATLGGFEKLLRRLRCDEYGGGCLLFLLLGVTWILVPSLIVYRVTIWKSTAGFILHVVLVYSLLALRDLFDHVRAVQRAARSDDLNGARAAIARLVGRDTDTMDLDACRRAAIESLSENFVDGFLSSVFGMRCLACRVCFSLRWPAPWIRWSGTRHLRISALDGAAHGLMI